MPGCPVPPRGALINRYGRPGVTFAETFAPQSRIALYKLFGVFFTPNLRYLFFLQANVFRRVCQYADLHFGQSAGLSFFGGHVCSHRLQYSHNTVCFVSFFFLLSIFLLDVDFNNIMIYYKVYVKVSFLY